MSATTAAMIIRYLRVLARATGLAAILCGCAGPPFAGNENTTVSVPKLTDELLSWRMPVYVDTLAGLRLLHDGPPVHSATIALTRAILRTNPRLAPTDALALAAVTVRDARERHLAPEFLGATLLQESAYDPDALSSAGAIGIAQFMPGTAQMYGVNPYDPYDAIAGSAMLLSSYVRAYRGRYEPPQFAALAAYNAGPGAVAAYGGIPPYPQTRAYIGDIVDRWAKILSYEAE